MLLDACFGSVVLSPATASIAAELKHVVDSQVALCEVHARACLSIIHRTSACLRFLGLLPFHVDAHAPVLMATVTVRLIVYGQQEW